jgi:hypothetical protein
MRPLIILTFLALSASTFGENVKLPELKLKNGKSYTAVTVTKKTAEGIAISHESGTARIPFEQLPDDLVETLGGFDTDQAAEARKAAAKAEAAHFTEMEHAEAENAESKIAKQELESAQPAIVEVIQAQESGALCRVAWIKKQKDFDTKTDAFGRLIKIPKEVLVNTGFQDAHIYVHGLKAVDKDRTGVRLIPSEPHVYTNTLGARITVRSYRIVGGAVDTSAAPVGVKVIPSPTRPAVSRMQRIGGG